MISFTIPYPKPKEKAKFCKEYGLNSIYAGKHWTKRQNDKDYWHMLVKSELSKQGIKREIFSAPVRIVFSWNDRLDIDNHAYMAKLIIDSIKGYLIYEDDKRYVVEVVHRYHDKDCILVEMEENQ